MTALPVQARHGPADMSVNGAESVVHVLAGQAGTDHNRPDPRRLQVVAKTHITTSRDGTQRQNLVVRCSCGCDHLHFAPIGVASVIRRGGCGVQYPVHNEVPW